MEGRREGRTPASGCRAHSLLYTSPCAQDKAGRTGLNLPDSHKVTKGDRTGTQAFLDSHFSTEHTCVCAVSSRVSIRVEQPSTQMLRDTGRRTLTLWLESQVLPFLPAELAYTVPQLWLLSLSPSPPQSRVAVMCYFLDTPGHLQASSP